jgi:hypothetical protein
MRRDAISRSRRCGCFRPAASTRTPRCTRSCRRRRHALAPPGREPGALHLGRIDEMGHAELFAQARRLGLKSTPTIISAPTRRRPWITFNPMPPRPNTTQCAPALTLAVFITAPSPGGDTAADVANLLERRVLADLCHRDLRQCCDIREGRCAHVVHNPGSVAGESAGAV